MGRKFFLLEHDMRPRPTRGTRKPPISCALWKNKLRAESRVTWNVGLQIWNLRSNGGERARIWKDVRAVGRWVVSIWAVGCEI